MFLEISSSILLKLDPRREISSIPRLLSTLTSRLPALAILATLITELSGLIIEFAKIKPTQRANNNKKSATRKKSTPKEICKLVLSILIN